MGLVAEVAQSAGVQVHRSGPTELVSGADLVQFLDAVRLRGLRVLGLEGFRAVDGRLIPDMDAIADFSSISGGAHDTESIDEALRFLSDVGEPSLLYDVTLSVGTS